MDSFYFRFRSTRRFDGTLLRAAAVMLALMGGGGASIVLGAPAPVLTVGPELDGRVQLYWDPIPSATRYEVRRFLDDLSATATSTPAAPASPTATATPLAVVLPEGTPGYLDGQVTNGRRYRYEVDAWDAGGPGPAAVTWVIPYADPLPVQPVYVSVAYSDSVSVHWEDSSTTYPIAYYEVYRYALMAKPTHTPSTPTFTPTDTHTPTNTPKGIWITTTFTNTFTPTDTPTDTPPSTPIPVATFMASSPVPLATVADTYYLDETAATPGPLAYYYMVRAVDSQPTPAMGAFPDVSSTGVLPRSKAPVAPGLSLLAGPSVTPVIGNTGFGVRLLWNAPVPGDGVTGYQIYRNDVLLTTVGVLPVTQQFYDDMTNDVGFSSLQRTSYYLLLSNASGSVSTNTAYASLQKAQVSSLQATPDATTQAVTLTWSNAVTGLYGLSGYEVFRSSWGLPVTGTSSPTPTPISVVAADPSQTATPYYVDHPVPNANGYSYWVAPVDAVSWLGPPATAVPATLRLEPGPPSAPEVTGPTGNNRVQVVCSGGTAGFYGPVQGYRIYRQFPGMTQSPTAVATVFVSNPTDIDVVEGVASQTPVVYRASALDAMGNASDLSGVSNPVTMKSLVAPGVSGGLKETGDNQSLVFSWAAAPAPDAVTGYRVFGPDWVGTLPTTPTPTPWAYVTPTTGVQSVTQSGLTPFQVVVNYLLADNAQGSSAPATLAGIPVPTYQVQAAVPAPTRGVSVSWNLQLPPPTGTPGLDGFRIYRSSVSGSGFTPVATAGISDGSCLDASASAASTYYYRITAKSGTLAESPLYPTLVPVPEAGVLTWPKAPQGATILGGSESATICWQPNGAGENVVSYSIYRDGATIPLATVLPSPSPSYLSAETPGVRSFYGLSAVNASGEGDLCGAVTVLPAPSVTPQIGFTPPPGVTSTPGKVWITGLSCSQDVAGYGIYRGVAATPLATPQETLIAVVPDPTPNFSDDGVTGYTTYYRVVARDASGLESSHAASPLLAIDMPPGSPQSLTANPSTSNVPLAWAVPPGNAPVTGYEVYRSTYSGRPKSALTSVAPPAVTYNDVLAVHGAVYYYYVTAMNASGEGQPSTEQNVLVLPGPTVQITASVSQNTICWVPVEPTATPPLSNYQVYRSQMPAGAYSLIGSVAVAASTPNRYVDSSISAGVTYAYKVVPASSSGAQGGYSAAVTQATLPQPVSLTIVSLDGMAQLSWDYQGAVSVTYQVQRRLGTEPDLLFGTVADNVSGSDYLDTGLVNKAMYVYRVLTTVSAGLTAVSNEAEALPARPPVVTGSVYADPIEQGVALNWTAANPGGFDPKNQYPLAGYRIYRSLDNGGTYRLVGSTTAIQYLDPVDVLSGDTRTYQVRAYDAPADAPDMAHESPYPSVRVDSLSADTALDRNSIRPFGSDNERKVNIRFVVTQEGHVSMKVYALSGVFVKQLVDDSFLKGVHWTSWDGTNRDGQRVASGVYLISTLMPNRHEVAKIAVIK